MLTNFGVHSITFRIGRLVRRNSISTAAFQTSPRGSLRDGPKSQIERRAFTLVELVFVIAVISILIALLLPAVQTTREVARRVQCGAHLSQIGVGLWSYHEAHSTMPPGYVSSTDAMGVDSGNGWAWAALLLPFVDAGTVYDSIQFEKPILDPINTTAVDVQLELFLCPSDPSQRSCAYVASSGRTHPARQPDACDGVFFRNSRIRRRDIKDGPHTILLGERAGNFGGAEWVGVRLGAIPPPGLAQRTTTAATPLPFLANSYALSMADPTRVLGHIGPDASLQTHRMPPLGQTASRLCSADFGGSHMSVDLFLMLDGSARPISRSADIHVLGALATRAGGEAIGSGAY